MRGGTDSRAIGQPGVGIAAARSGLFGVALSQNLKDSGSDKDRNGDGKDDGTGAKFGKVYGTRISSHGSAGNFRVRVEALAYPFVMIGAAEKGRRGEL